MRRIAYTLLVVLASLAAPAAQSAVTVFEGARVITGDGRAPIDNASIVVSAGRITQVGAAPGVQVPAGATRVNLTGKTVMPLIVDTHVHLSATRDAVEQDLRRRLEWGVGAAMSLGQDAPALVADLRARPVANAARYFTAGRGITAPEPGRTQAPYWITTAAQGRTAVQELAAQRVDIVKIWVDDRNGQYKKLTPDLYRAIIDEAHRNNLRVTAHLFTLEDAKGLIKAGVDAFAHGVRDRDVDDELMSMLAAKPQFVLVPNLPDRSNTEAFGIQARNLARMNRAGVRIALGSDGNNPEAPHAEMADMVAAGMTPMQVVVAATRNGAEFLRMQDAGTIEAGKSADFLVLEANPLDDIANSRRISAVYHGGGAVTRTVK